ncbi:hypothetical protein CVT24_000266 [Panaeolus cyanescens]|uniref:Uncharacterized protein n=1 Tax=Panaeolus cyanescens TaxID=181874 RepID=A0A409YD59_9AGAR|nr:hypothetical protein CVT24_000266 [Panaeolus cyanescens]
MVNVVPTKKATTVKKSTGGLPPNPNKNTPGSRYGPPPKPDNRELGIAYADKAPIEYVLYGKEDSSNRATKPVLGLLTVKYNSHQDSNMFYPSPKRFKNALKKQTPDQKACPLKISFSCGDWTKTVDEQSPYHAMDPVHYWDIFLDCIDRWASLEIWAPFVPRYHLQKKGVPEWKNSAPILRNVVLTGPKGFNIVETAQFLSPLWRNSPLDSFAIKQVSEVPYDSLAPLLFHYVPTQHLTQLRIDCKLSVIGCCLLLSSFPSLVNCTFGDVTGPAVDGPTVMFTCGELESLKLVVDYEDHRECRETYIWDLLDRLVAPKLRRFVVECDDRWQNTSFLAFLDRSQCVLEALEFLLVRIDPESFLQNLRRCFNLRVLMYKPDYTQTPTAISREVLTALDPEGEDLLADLELLALNEDALGGLLDGEFSRALRKNAYYDDLDKTYTLRLCWFEVTGDHEEHVQRKKDAMEFANWHNPMLQVWMSGNHLAKAWEEEVEACLRVRCVFAEKEIPPLVFIPETFI